MSINQYIYRPVGRERERDGCGLTSNPIRDATEYIYITIYMYVYRLFETKSTPFGRERGRVVSAQRRYELIYLYVYEIYIIPLSNSYVCLLGENSAECA